MPSKVIAVSQQKGGAGKTTVAIHLAIAFAQKGYKVAVIDADPQASLSTWYKTRMQHKSDDMVDIYSGILSNWWGLKTEIERLRQEYEIVVIDTPPHTKNESEIAVKEADLVIVPMQPSPTDLWATASTLELAVRENPDTYLLLNRVVHNSRLAKQIIDELPKSRIQSIIGSRVGFANALAYGKAVTETEPGSDAAEEIWELHKEVEGMLERLNQLEKQSV